MTNKSQHDIEQTKILLKIICLIKVAFKGRKCSEHSTYPVPNVPSPARHGRSTMTAPVATVTEKRKRSLENTDKQLSP